MSVTREVRANDWCVSLDLGSQVLNLEIPEVVFARRADPDGEESLRPTLPTTEEEPVSAATLLLKAKQFDDGLYAAVELAAQRGAGRFPGKASLLRSLTHTLAAWLPDNGVTAAANCHAACCLGGLSVSTHPSLDQAVAAAVAAFLQNECLSKPLGFYTWSDELSAIFRQDRFLQQPLDPTIANVITDALSRTAGAVEAHDACLRLNHRLTNPPARAGLRDETGSRAFFPACRSHEQVLLEQLFGDKPIPDGFDLMSELIRRVRAGEIDLRPGEHSGWYDHQTWSLEPLILPDRTPEASRLELGERYHKHLEELFRGALALARETHVKQLAIAVGGCAGPMGRPIRVTPDLSVEPLPSLYSRRAACYEFVRSVLEEAFGPDALGQMHRLAADGPVATNLAEELAAVQRLFEGASAVARNELGLESPATTSSGEFLEWRKSLSIDPDVSRDARMMVPVFHDVGRRKTKVWAFLGWRTAPVDVSYRVEPTVLGLESRETPESEPPPTDRLAVLRRKFRKAPADQPAGPPPVVFSGSRYYFNVPVLAEVYVSRLLDREEFRRHCDRFRTRAAILANLR